jgi:hypothetical protein
MKIVTWVAAVDKSRAVGSFILGPCFKGTKAC